MDINGLPLLWDVGQTLEYNPENGALKSAGSFDQRASLDLLADAFDSWALLPGVNLNILQGAFLPDQGLPDGVNQSNYAEFLGAGTEECYPDFFGTSGANCVSPIIFDEDGEIIDDLFGQCAKFSILGFAGFDEVEDGTGDPARRIVRRGQALFSGACLNPSVTKSGCGSCQRVLTDGEIRTIVTHEVGHMMGMDHSQVNPEAFSECSGNPGGCPKEVVQALPTMFPILVNGAQMLDLHRDDEAYFMNLYGDTLNDGCTVSGTVFASDNSTQVRGVEVVAINTNSQLELSDRVSFISGAEAPKKNSFSKSQGNCVSDCGAYKITSLGRGETYQLCVQRISTQFTGGSSIEPVDPPFQKFSNDCPAGLTVTCDCPAGTLCPEITGVNITTDTDPGDVDLGDDEPDNLGNFDMTTDSGGCSLSKAPKLPTLLWISLKKSLLRFL